MIQHTLLEMCALFFYVMVPFSSGAILAWSFCKLSFLFDLRDRGLDCAISCLCFGYFFHGHNRNLRGSGVARWWANYIQDSTGEALLDMDSFIVEQVSTSGSSRSIETPSQFQAHNLDTPDLYSIALFHYRQLLLGSKGIGKAAYKSDE